MEWNQLKSEVKEIINHLRGGFDFRPVAVSMKVGETFDSFRGPIELTEKVAEELISFAPEWKDWTIQRDDDNVHLVFSACGSHTYENFLQLTGNIKASMEYLDRFEEDVPVGEDVVVFDEATNEAEWALYRKDGRLIVEAFLQNGMIAWRFATSDSWKLSKRPPNEEEEKLIRELCAHI